MAASERLSFLNIIKPDTQVISPRTPKELSVDHRIRMIEQQVDLPLPKKPQLGNLLAHTREQKSKIKFRILEKLTAQNAAYALLIIVSTVVGSVLPKYFENPALSNAVGR